MLKPNRKLNTGESYTEDSMGNLISELLNSATRTHIAHLKTTSFAAHTALGEFYDGVVDITDNLAEQWQGATEELLTCSSSQVDPLYSVDEAIDYLRSLYRKVNIVAERCQYSEICNTLDEIKSLINTTKYKLIFLK